MTKRSPSSVTRYNSSKAPVRRIANRPSRVLAYYLSLLISVSSGATCARYTLANQPGSQTMVAILLNASGTTA